MSRPRTPRYFPRMKVRGARRRQGARHQRMLRALDQMTVAMRFMSAVALPATMHVGEFVLALGRNR